MLSDGEATLTYAMPSGALAKANEIVTGTASLADMAGNEWLLAKWSATEAVSPETIAYFHVPSANLTGKGPCNTFTAPIVGDATVFKIKVGPIAATKMACADQDSRWKIVSSRRSNRSRGSASAAVAC